jgi:hypothetical protein
MPWFPSVSSITLSFSVLLNSEQTHLCSVNRLSRKWKLEDYNSPISLYSPQPPPLIFCVALRWKGTRICELPPARLSRWLWEWVWLFLFPGQRIQREALIRGKPAKLIRILSFPFLTSFLSGNISWAFVLVTIAQHLSFCLLARRGSHIQHVQHHGCSLQVLPGS